MIGAERLTDAIENCKKYTNLQIRNDIEKELDLEPNSLKKSTMRNWI